jgi:hypothetical protein
MGRFGYALAVVLRDRESENAQLYAHVQGETGSARPGPSPRMIYRLKRYRPCRS